MPSFTLPANNLKSTKEQTLIDLHVHTTASDGVLVPNQMVKKAKDFGLAALGICDHDSVDGLKEAICAGVRYRVEIIPGVELSCYWKEQNKREFHILGYFIDFEDKKFLERLAFFRQERAKRAKKSLKILRKLGYRAEWRRLLKLAKGSIGRPHLVKTVVQNPLNQKILRQKFGKIPSTKEFLEEYITPGKPAFVEKEGFEPKEAIDWIHKIGGIAVVAHPGFDIEIGDRKTLQILKNWGLDGLEVIAPIETIKRTQKSIKYFSKAAQEYDFLVTGGSDCHGIEEVGAGMGMLEWSFKIEYQILENLKCFLNENKSRYGHIFN